MPLTSTMPKAEASALPSPAPAVEQVPAKAAEPRPQQQGEAHQADRAFHAMLAHLTGGISPVALLLAYTDWLSHLASSPQRQIEISQGAVQNAKRLVESAQHQFGTNQGPWSLIKPQPQDRRFARPEWESPPFNLFAQAFLLGEQWWHNATTGVRGVSKQNEAIVEFSVRQMLDVLAPSNFAATNPEVLQKAFQSSGENFVAGWQNFCRAISSSAKPLPPRAARSCSATN
jgi:polyhydroxyalkanoate synthase